MNMRPMLASTPTQEVLKKHLSETYLYASRKLDGIRALTTNSGLVSRSLKLIRNEYIQETLKELPSGLDGELVVGSPSAADVFNKTTSGVMSSKGKPDFTYVVFDLWNSDRTYDLRYTRLINCMNLIRGKLRLADLGNFVLLSQVKITTINELDTIEELYLSYGYEGVIVRRPDTPYKFNRATNREGYLMKIKRYREAEAIITGVNQKFHNANEATINELGLTSRSSSKENKVPLEQVGSFEVRDLKEGWVFEVHGFSHIDAAIWWVVRDSLVGKIVTYKYLAVGMKDVPRHPIFKGFRNPDDIEEAS